MKVTFDITTGYVETLNRFSRIESTLTQAQRYLDDYANLCLSSAPDRFNSAVVTRNELEELRREIENVYIKIREEHWKQERD